VTLTDVFTAGRRAGRRATGVRHRCATLSGLDPSVTGACGPSGKQFLHAKTKKVTLRFDDGAARRCSPRREGTEFRQSSDRVSCGGPLSRCQCRVVMFPQDTSRRLRTPYSMNYCVKSTDLSQIIQFLIIVILWHTDFRITQQQLRIIINQSISRFNSGN